MGGGVGSAYGGGGGGGGAAPSVDTYANLVASTPDNGTIGIATDDPLAYLVYAGSAWRQYYKGVRVTPPSSGSFSDHATPGTTTTTVLGERLYHSTGAYARLATVSNEYVRVGVDNVADDQSYCEHGMILRDSAASRHITWALSEDGAGNVQLRVTRYSGTAYTFSATALDRDAEHYTQLAGSGPIIWGARIEASQWSVGFWLSPESPTSQFVPVYTESNATWLTNGPDQAGAHINRCSARFFHFSDEA